MKIGVAHFPRNVLTHLPECITLLPRKQ